MPSTELDNLVRIGSLKREPPSAREQQGLLDSVRLEDSGQASLSFDSRFDLAYNASHSLALYALRRLGYRAEYEGHLERDERLLADLIAAAKRLCGTVSALPPVDEHNA
jgi:hypothetical protein